MSPLLKFNSFYYEGENSSDDLIKVITNLLQEHKDWKCKIDLKWNQLEDRNIKNEKN
jgi:hypothetical protein